jgi:hypothetical protein
VFSLENTTSLPSKDTTAMKLNAPFLIIALAQCFTSAFAGLRTVQEVRHTKTSLIFVKTCQNSHSSCLWLRFRTLLKTMNRLRRNFKVLPRGEWVITIPIATATLAQMVQVRPLPVKEEAREVPGATMAGLTANKGAVVAGATAQPQ